MTKNYKKNNFAHKNNLLNATFQTHPIKMCCCNTITKCLIVTTINPIWHSHAVHPGTKIFTICSLTSKENIIFAVEKLQFSLFLISCCQGILNSSWLSWYLVLKIACLHVSFTAYENFYKLSKMYCLLIWISTF